MNPPMPGEIIEHAGRLWEVLEIGLSSESGLHLVARDATNPRGPKHEIPLYGGGVHGECVGSGREPNTRHVVDSRNFFANTWVAVPTCPVCGADVSVNAAGVAEDHEPGDPAED